MALDMAREIHRLAHTPDDVRWIIIAIRGALDGRCPGHAWCINRMNQSWQVGTMQLADYDIGKDDQLLPMGEGMLMLRAPTQSDVLDAVRDEFDRQLYFSHTKLRVCSWVGPLQNKSNNRMTLDRCEYLYAYDSMTAEQIARLLPGLLRTTMAAQCRHWNPDAGCLPGIIAPDRQTLYEPENNETSTPSPGVCDTPSTTCDLNLDIHPYVTYGGGRQSCHTSVPVRGT